MGFECKFEPVERDLKHLNANKLLERDLRHAFEPKFDPFESNSKHSNANSNYSNGI